MGGLTRIKQGISIGLSTLLVFTIGPGAATSWAYQSTTTPTAGSTAPPYSGQGVPATAAELQSLVAPIALYPDALVAQILSAATFPDQIGAASYWMQQNPTLTGSALMQAVNKQTWDPSVKALTQFPTVLNNMAKNLAWTSQLGEDYHNQPADVMKAIQTLRAQAEAAGNLKTTPQQTVTTETQNGQQIIVIQSANPQIIYVPTYNPTIVYGTPYTVPGYSTSDMVATGVLSFGLGIAVGAMMSGGCCGWGYSSWNCNWYGGGAYYHGGAYYGNTAWHGGYYGYGGSAYGAYGSAHYGEGYNPSTGTYARGGSIFNPLRSHVSRAGIQPIHRGLWPNPSDFYQWRAIWKLVRLERRHVGELRALFGRQRNGCRRVDLKWQQVCGSQRQRLQEHRERLGESGFQ